MTAAELLESALKTCAKRGMTDLQTLILLALARSGKPLRTTELVEATKRYRQTVNRALDAMDGREVRVDRMNQSNGRSAPIVHLREEGVEVLCDILTTTKRS